MSIVTATSDAMPFPSQEGVSNVISFENDILSLIATSEDKGAVTNYKLFGSYDEAKEIFSLESALIENALGRIECHEINQDISFKSTDSILNLQTVWTALTEQDDTFRLSDGINSVETGDGNDWILGGGSADTSLCGSGQDFFDGSSGLDTSIYSGLLNSYTIANEFVSWRITDGIPDRDGIDTLLNVERLQFSDSMLALDFAVSENAGMAYRLYKAAFDRTPDLGGVGYWIYRIDNGLSVQSAAQEFINSDEFTSLYGSNPTDSQFVTLLYEHVMHRPAEGEGFNFWVNALSPQGGWSRASVLSYFSESDENLAQTAELVANGVQYNEFVAS